jgi:hypothetical protein
MDNRQEIEGLIEQLKGLQLQQTAVLDRLERLAESERGANVPADAAGGTEPPIEFALGDRVRIKNPRPFQQAVGIITKIGPSRITVTTRNGTKVQRAASNLVAAPGRYVDDE